MLRAFPDHDVGARATIRRDARAPGGGVRAAGERVSGRCRKDETVACVQREPRHIVPETEVYARSHGDDQTEPHVVGMAG